jgi:hypothetical protein
MGYFIHKETAEMSSIMMKLPEPAVQQFSISIGPKVQE